MERSRVLDAVECSIGLISEGQHDAALELLASLYYYVAQPEPVPDWPSMVAHAEAVEQN